METKAREFILTKSEVRDFNAIEVHPLIDCDPKDIEAERILKYIRVIEYSAYDQSQKRVEELEKENRQSHDGLILIHNLLLDFYSEPDKYWDNPNLAFKKVNEVLDELTKLRNKKAIGEVEE